jgi:hypothetical protein
MRLRLRGVLCHGVAGSGCLNGGICWPGFPRHPAQRQRASCCPLSSPRRRRPALCHPCNDLSQAAYQQAKETYINSHINRHINRGSAIHAQRFHRSAPGAVGAVFGRGASSRASWGSTSLPLPRAARESCRIAGRSGRARRSASRLHRRSPEQARGPGAPGRPPLAVPSEHRAACSHTICRTR